MDIKISDERWNKIIVDVVEDRMHELDEKFKTLAKSICALDDESSKIIDEMNDLIKEQNELDVLRKAAKPNAHTD